MCKTADDLKISSQNDTAKNEQLSGSWGVCYSQAWGGGVLVGTYPYRDDATIRITKQIHTSFTAHNSIRLCDKHIPNSQ